MNNGNDKPVLDIISAGDKRTILKIHPDKVDITENIRFGEHEDKDDWAEFKKTIKASNGNLVPVECDYDPATDTYKSTGGRRRVLACRELGLDVTIASRDGVRSLATRLEEGLILNKARGNSWWNYVTFCQKVMKPELGTAARRKAEAAGQVPRQSEVKERLGAKDSTWSRYMQIAEALPARWIQDLASRGAKKELALALVAIEDQQEREKAFLHYLEHGEIPSTIPDAPPSSKDGGAGGAGGDGSGEGSGTPTVKPSLAEKLRALAGIVDTDGTKSTALHMSQALGFTTGTSDAMTTMSFTITGVQLCRLLACRDALHEKGSPDVLAMLGISNYREDPAEQYALRVRQTAVVLKFAGIETPVDPDEAAAAWYEKEVERAKREAEEAKRREAEAKVKAEEKAKADALKKEAEIKKARELLAKLDNEKASRSQTPSTSKS